MPMLTHYNNHFKPNLTGWEKILKGLVATTWGDLVELHYSTTLTIAATVTSSTKKLSQHLSDNYGTSTMHNLELA